MIRYVLCAAVLAAGTAVAAADVRVALDAIEAESTRCFEGAVSNNDMKQCAHDSGAKSDKLLNEAYAAIIKGFIQRSDDQYSDEANAEMLKRLKVSQRAWVRFRDANCALESGQMLGGSGEDLINAGCLHRMTVERIRFLEDQFHPADE